MIKGINTIEHEAPYPEAIPNLLFDIHGEKAKYVLDPFGGTMTTTKAAFKRGIKSVCIEQSLLHCLKEINNLKLEASKLTLFEQSLLGSIS